MTFTVAEKLKFALLAEGLHITDEARAHIDAANDGRAITPADYASTTGVILSLPDDVWVNAPFAVHNPNFVTAPSFSLDLGADQLVVRGAMGGDEVEVFAQLWLPPEYHGGVNDHGEPYDSYAFTHGDRVRISPVEGCAMTCKFCDLPYEFKYRTKRIDGLVDSVRTALADPRQPAYHVLISGGVPKADDYRYLRDAYAAVISEFPQVDVDVMMVPIDDVLDVDELVSLGVSELSINIEVVNRELARTIMRRKFDQGLDHYLDVLERAAARLGPGRVRSMLMVGLEPMEDTIAGVEAIAQRGAVPVLSPFRPDQATPLRDHPPPDAAFLEETYVRARDAAAAHGVALGPSCIPCTHNTLTFAATGSGDADRFHGHPVLI